MRPVKIVSAILPALLLVGTLFVAPSAGARAVGVASLASGAYTFTIDDLSSGHYGIGIYKNSAKLHEQSAPLLLQIKDSGSNEVDYQSAYSGYSSQNGIITCTGSITTNNGSIFNYTDTYSVYDATGAFMISRSVAVSAAGSGDVGFSTRFSMYSLASTNMSDYNMFAPGNWYKQNSNVVPGAFASAYSDENFFIKETRLALPLFSMQTISSGETLTLEHPNAGLSTAQSEMSDSWLVDAGFQFGSFGIKKSPRTTINYTYPSWEGDKNYYGNDQNSSLHLNGMVRRSHPVQTSGVNHSYSLIIKLGQSSSFSGMVTAVYRHCCGIYNPTPTYIAPDTVYNNDISYFNSVYKSFSNGGNGMPWSAWTLNGGVRDYHLESGFVGQQTKVGWELLRDGYKTGNQTEISEGTAMVGFWADNSMTPSGIPKTDYFCETSSWGTDPLFLRTVSDACEGVLDAYNTAFANGVINDGWLIYCQRFGDFLVANQASDGSWARSYNQDGTVNNSGKFNTTNPIRFLVKLYLCTHDQRYLSAAVNAGTWSLANVDNSYLYVGGTPDNNNTIDKESGVMALNAFNALYDVTEDSKWLAAAEDAANYIETWVFSYNYNVNPATRWCASSGVYPAWLEVDLGADYDVQRVETMFEFGNAYYQYKIETSTDNANWSSFVDKSQNTARPSGMGYVDSASPRTARYVRITVTGVEGGGAWPSIYEFKVYDARSTDLAQGKTATASSEQDVCHNAAKAVDGTGTPSSNSPWPAAGLIGQSLVATGHSYTDTFMINCPAEFYRLYLFSGDTNYLTYAKIFAYNANEPADFDGRLGYQYKASLGEGIMCNNFSAFYGTECLTWQTAVQMESICMLEDLFGYKKIEDIESNLDSSNRQMLNHLAYQYGGYKPVSIIANGKTYKIVNRNSGRLLDVQGASTVSHANIWQYHDIGGTGQQWSATDKGNGFWKFLNINSRLAMDVAGDSTVNGGNILQNQDGGTTDTSQGWQTIGIGQGYWKIKNENSARLADVEASGRDDGRNVSQYDDTGGKNQQWAFYDIPTATDAIVSGGIYKIVNRATEKLLEVSKAGANNGTNVDQWHDLNPEYTSNTALGQLWEAVDCSNGYWKLISVNTLSGEHEVMDLEGSNTANGTNITIYQDNGTDNQQWQIYGIGGGYWKIYSKLEPAGSSQPKLVDLEASSTCDGKNISLYQDTGATGYNQQWLFCRIQ